MKCSLYLFSGVFVIFLVRVFDIFLKTCQFISFFWILFAKLLDYSVMFHVKHCTDYRKSRLYLFHVKQQDDVTEEYRQLYSILIFLSFIVHFFKMQVFPMLLRKYGDMQYGNIF